MNQTALLRDFDANATFFRTGMVDAAIYVADPDADPAQTPVPCTVLVDRDVTDFGDELAPVSVPVVLVSFQRAEVDPVTGAQVTLTATGEVFDLIRRVRADESISRWEVQHAQSA